MPTLPTVSQATLLASSLVVLLIGCTGGGDSPQAAGGTRSGASMADTAVASSTPALPAPASPATSPARRAALEDAARQVVRFLSGRSTLDTLALADTVELHLPPEGAGTTTGASVKLARSALRERDAWMVRADRRSFSFVPPHGLTRTTARAGTHFNCREVPLASRAPALASRPHVGVRLEPPESKSCLDGWNATFVFDTAGAHPRLVAALYDQWEW